MKLDTASGPAALVREARAAGVQLWLEGHRLRFRAPAGALPDALRQALSEQRNAILEYLREEARAHVTEGPLAENQQGLWVLHQLAPDSAAYNVATVVRLRGPLDMEAFREALQVLLDRHESLRSIYPRTGDQPMRQVHGWEAAELRLVDASGWDDARLHAELRADYLQPFDLHAGPVVRFHLYREASERHVFMLQAHHIATDGTSLFILLEQFLDTYAALAAHAAVPARPDAASFGEFIAWQQARLGVADEDLAYWHQVLTPPAPELDLPTSRARSAGGGAGGTYRWMIPASLTAELRALARSHGVTDYVCLLALWYLLLHVLSGKDDIVVGTPVQGRPAARFARTVGDFVNTLPLRVRTIGQLSFTQLLDQVRTVVLEGMAHQEYPLIRMLKDAPRSDAGGPPFRTTFVLQDFGRFELVDKLLLGSESDSLSSGGLTWSPVPIAQQEGQFELSLDIWPSQQELTCLLRYDSVLYDTATIESWGRTFATLAASAVANPGRTASELVALAPADRARLDEWNATTRAFRGEGSVSELFAAQAGRTPDRPAVSAPRHGKSGAPLHTWTYAELHEYAGRVAAALQLAGVQPGDRVGILMERGRELLGALLGIMGAGATYIPIDPSYPEARIHFVLEDSGAPLVVTHAGLHRRFELAVPVLDLDAWSPPAPVPFVAVPPAQAAYVIYTSGSTGKPKGVEIPHCALRNFLLSMRETPGMTPADRLLAVTTISFDIAALELYLPLITGASVCIANEDDVFDARRLVQRMEQFGVTLMQATPATWKLLLAGGWTGRPDLRVLCGGEPLSRSLADELLQRVGELWNMYGPTETTVWSTVERITPDGPILIGRPIANTTVYVLGSGLNLRPIGVPGELCIGGIGVATGYVNRPELTDERFVASPFVAGERLYRTGDLARYRSDGRLEHLGRFDHQVKVRGFRVELGEIESALLAHGAIRDAVAAASDDRLVAYVVYEEGEFASTMELRSWLAASLPPYMVPSLIVPLEALPLTPNGKVDRRALPDPFAEAAGPRHYEAPTDPLACSIAEVWSSLVQVERIGLDDNFFDIGGHSLLAIQAVALIEERTGVRPEPRSLFFKSLRELAASLSSTGESA